MVNPDGKLWLDRFDVGRIDTGTYINPAEVERIIRLVAAHMRGEVHESAPIVSAELPETGERFEGLLPPVALAPCFAIRKPAEVIYQLSDYVEAGIMLPLQAKTLSEAVVDRKNIVVVGGTSSARPRWSMLCWPKLLIPMTVSLFSRIHENSTAPHKMWFLYEPNQALQHWAIWCVQRYVCALTALSLVKYVGRSA